MEGSQGTKWQHDLTSLIEKLLSISRENFRGRISYVAGNWEYSQVPWNKFDMICVNAYIHKWDSKDKVANYLTHLGNKFSKPVYVTEFGSATYTGAGQYGGAGSISSGPYDEGEQVRYIDAYLDMINGINSPTRIVDSCFYWCFLDDPQTEIAKEASLLNSKTKGRKKSFHRYKSYKRVGS